MHTGVQCAKDVLVTEETTKCCAMQDDSIGAEFPLCESDFNSADAQDNMVRWFADTQFDAVLYCGDCKLPSPPPPSIAALDPNDGVTSFAAVICAP